MTRSGGLGRGLSSLIPSKKDRVDFDLSLKENEIALEDDQSYPNRSSNKKRLPKLGDLKKELKDTNRRIPRNVSGVSALEESEIDNKAGLSKEGGDSSKRIEIVLVDSVIPNPYQPRRIFESEALESLANSIQEHGLLQPLIVTKLEEGIFELIAGERRLRASKLAGLKKIPVIIEREVQNQKKAELALIENLQRSDLNIIEEVRAYKKMQEEFSMTQEQIANRVGKSRSRVANALRLLNLPIEIQRGLMSGVVSEGHARSLLGLQKDEEKRSFYDLIVKEDLSVRQVEIKIRQYLKKEKRTKNNHQQVDPMLYQKESQISNYLGTRVRIKKKNKSGQIVIEFYSDEELDSLISRLV